jgi:hypothetical protein
MMVSLWWVAAAFFVGSYAGALLVALMSMARDETAMPRNGMNTKDAAQVRELQHEPRGVSTSISGNWHA